MTGPEDRPLPPSASDMNEGTRRPASSRARYAPSDSTHASHPLVLPHVVPGRSPGITSDMNEEPVSGRRHSPLFLAFAAVVGIIILGMAGGFFFLDSTAPWLRLGPAPDPSEIPPALRTYYDQAQEGDASAMRMLGTMYYNGLNVRKNKAEGIRWFRKAANAGSVAAHKDLEQLGLTSPAR